ncbi:hypothetical protein HJG60_008560 [Phyllostomus discolor]|uniref:Uncharacterized protein n=1 Tax=Phyllostomus discolor TaxID=89673 RepID=A0A833Z0B7_9CHIR|nr:hypothetical protein HJG60_008560 [Phyllostomus discolor]
MPGFRQLHMGAEGSPYQRKPVKQKPIGGNEPLLCAHMGFQRKEAACFGTLPAPPEAARKGWVCVSVTRRRCLPQRRFGCNATGRIWVKPPTFLDFQKLGLQHVPLAMKGNALRSSLCIGVFGSKKNWGAGAGFRYFGCCMGKAHASGSLWAAEPPLGRATSL